jgi:hypothetical protein
VKRKAKILRYNDSGDIAICIDIENWVTILRYIGQSNQHKKKFQYILSHIFSRLRNTDIYDKEEINNKSKGVTAMKFFKGHSNDRIYCREMTLEDKTFIVIAAELLEKKKNQKINQIQRNLIEKVGSYEYEIID